MHLWNADLGPQALQDFCDRSQTFATTDTFATKPLASWAGVCPSNKQSGEKRQRGPTRKGNGWLKPALVEAARSAGRTKTYLGAQYRRLSRRIGANRAAMAVAHSIAVIIHHIIKKGQTFVDLGHNYFQERDREAITRRAVRRL